MDTYSDEFYCTELVANDKQMGGYIERKTASHTDWTVYSLA